MREPSPRALIAAMQILSISATATILTAGFTYPAGEDWVQNLGQTLTMVLFFITAICHFQAKKGRILPGPLMLLSLIPPLYAALSGPVRYVMTYHVLVLAGHGLVLWNLEKKRKAELQSEEAVPESVDPDQGEG